MGAMEKSIHTPEYRDLRSELRRTRENAGLSQRELAARLEVPHSWVAKVETGERRLDLVEFCRFAAACEVDPVRIGQRLLRSIAARQYERASKGGRST